MSAADDYGPIIDRANSRLAECRKQRDELVVALRDAESRFDGIYTAGCDEKSTIAYEGYTRCCAALAKVTP